MVSKDFPVISVSQLTLRIKEQLESTFYHLEVRGEVSNFKCQSSGHLYFSIKDASSQLPVVMFRGKAQQLEKLPRDGDQVVIAGSINVYTPRGYYQLMASTLRFCGTGDLLLLIEQLKKKIGDLGWFDQEHKKPFPLLPKKIALITSPTGSVIRDMLHVLNRRHRGFGALVCPIRVQGEEAAREIAEAIGLVNQFSLADAIILARGGGSIEDLMPFNSEVVLKAIHASRIPLISAVGHETDTTLSDLVADLRAPTPSAGAELILGEKRQLIGNLQQIRQAMLKPLLAQLKNQRKLIATYHRHPGLVEPLRHLAPHWQRIDDLNEQIAVAWRSKQRLQNAHLQRLRSILIALNPKRQLEEKGSNLGRIFQLIFAAFRGFARAQRAVLLQRDKSFEQMGCLIIARFTAKLSIEAVQRRMNDLWQIKRSREICRIQQLRDLLTARNPHYLIKRGYAIVYSRSESDSKTKIPLIKVDQVRRAKELSIQLSDGLISADVIGDQGSRGLY